MAMVSSRDRPREGARGARIRLFRISLDFLAPPEGEMPKIKGPFWVVLVFVYSKGAVVRT